MDSQSVKTTEECRKSNSGVYDAHSSGYDAHKNVKGRKRHLLVDTLGLPLSVYVSPADVQDQVVARLLLAGLKPLAPRLKKIWADGAYSGEPLTQWCREQGGWDLEIVERDRETKGFEVIPKRWIAERTISWLCRNHRMSKDYERRVQTSECLMEVAMTRLSQDGVCELEEGISPAVEAFVERAAEGAKSIEGRFHSVPIMHPPRAFRILSRQRA